MATNDSQLFVKYASKRCHGCSSNFTVFCGGDYEGKHSLNASERVNFCPFCSIPLYHRTLPQEQEPNNIMGCPFCPTDDMPYRIGIGEHTLYHCPACNRIYT